jgi:hypothetical protein
MIAMLRTSLRTALVVAVGGRGDRVGAAVLIGRSRDIPDFRRSGHLIGGGAG